MNLSPVHFAAHCNYADGLSALVNACASKGFRVNSLNSTAGEISAVQVSDPNSKLVFGIWEKPAGKTWVKAGIDRGDAKLLSKSASQILDAASATILPNATKGRI